MIQLKQIFGVSFVTTLILFFPVDVRSQQQAGCFMLDANGKPMDIGSVCGVSSQKKKPTELGLVQIPIERREHGVPVIKVKFNDQHIVEMLLDTGASSTVLTDPIAKLLNVKKEGVIIASTPSDNNVEFVKGRVASIAVGTAKMQDVMVAISPSLDIGLLGQNFYKDYDVTIREKMVEFRRR